MVDQNSTSNSGGAFTDDDITKLMGEVETDKLSRGVAWPVLAGEMNVPSGTLSSFFSAWPKGSYQGDVQKMASALAKWSSNRKQRQSVARQSVVIPTFQETPTAEDILTSLRFAQHTPMITMVVGVPGIGKTTTAEQYADVSANVHLVTMEPSMNTPNGLMMEIAETIGIAERSPSRLSGAIGKRLKGIGALLIIDEAQHLKIPALDQLRSFHDKYKFGIALLGNETLEAVVFGKRDTSTAQIRSRIGMKRTKKKLTPGDACMLIERWGVTNPDSVMLLKAIAAKPGALRNITMVMRQASLAAIGTDGAVTPDLIRQSWAALSDERGGS